MNYWIKERSNPQIGVYYVAYGKMTKKSTKKYESPLYGSNVMLSFPDEQAYLEKIQDLLNSGESVQWSQP